MSYLIINQIPAVSVDTITNTVRNLTIGIANYKVNLTDEQKQGMRTMAEGREGYVRLISQIANNNVNSLPRENNPADLSGRLAYDGKLEEARQAILTLLETISETQTANSLDIMLEVDGYVSALQSSRKRNAALDLSMREVDDWNARFAHKPEEENKTGDQEGEDKK